MNYVENFNLLGVEVMQLPCIKGKGKPTTATKGAVGLLYMDTVTSEMYKCTAVNGEDYNWDALVVLPANIVQTVNGKAPDKTGNVQVEAGGGGSEIFRVYLFDGCPEDDEEGWIERTLAAIRAGKIIEVYEMGEGGYFKVSYGWWMIGEWDDETEEEIPVYHVGDWTFREGGSGEGDEDEDDDGEGGEDEGGEDETSKLVITFEADGDNGYLDCTYDEFTAHIYSDDGIIAEDVVEIVDAGGNPLEWRLNEDMGFELYVECGGETFYFGDTDDPERNENTNMYFSGQTPDDEGGEDYGGISDYDITIAEFEGYSSDEDGDMPPHIVIRGISKKDLLNFYKEGVTSFVATYDDDTELGTPGEQVECTFEFEEEEEDSWWLTEVRTDNDYYCEVEFE